MEGEERVGGQATFRFGAAAAPLLQKRGEERVPGVEDVPRLQFLPDLPPRRRRTSARHSCRRSPATDRRRTSAAHRPYPAGRAGRCTAPSARRDAKNRARSAPAPGPAPESSSFSMCCVPHRNRSIRQGGARGRAGPADGGLGRRGPPGRRPAGRRPGRRLSHDLRTQAGVQWPTRRCNRRGDTHRWMASSAAC